MSARIRRILVAVGEQPASRALARAVQLAKLSGASVHLVTVVNPGPQFLGLTPAEQASIRAARVSHYQRLIERRARPFAKAGILLTCAAVAAYSVVDAIVNAARGFDLLVVEARKRSAIGRMFVSHTDVELIRRSPVPLLLVKRSLRRKGPLLVALDPWHRRDKSANLDNVLVRYGRRMSDLLRAPVHTAHVYTDILGMTGEYAAGGTPAFSTHRQDAYVSAIWRRFARHNRTLGIPRSRTHLRMGDPAFILPEIASELKAQLMIMGAVSRSSLVRVFVGNTAEKVLDLAPCDLLVLKSGKANRAR